MSKRVLFEKVGERIIEMANALILKEEDKIQAVQLWNNQLDNDDIEEAILFPVVYLEFSDIEWSPIALGNQKGNVDLAVHIAVERYSTDDRTYLDIVDAVYSALQGYSEKDCFSSLERTNDAQDVDHANCIDWITNFRTVLIDTTADKTKTRVPVTDPKLQLDVEVDIDSDVIRSGDGTFS